MTKDTFLYALEKELKNLPQKECEGILKGYREHIEAEVNHGASEDEVIFKLGTPEEIAKRYVVDRIVDLAEQEQSTGNVFRAVLALVSLGFFNLIFVLGPFVAIIGVIIGLYGAAFGFTLSGVIMALAALFVDWIPHYMMSVEPTLSIRAFLLTFGTGVGALGLLMGIGTTWGTKQFYRLTLKYIRFNIKLIRGKKSGV